MRYINIFGCTLFFTPVDFLNPFILTLSSRPFITADSTSQEMPEFLPLQWLLTGSRSSYWSTPTGRGEFSSIINVVLQDLHSGTTATKQQSHPSTRHFQCGDVRLCLSLTIRQSRSNARWVYFRYDWEASHPLSTWTLCTTHRNIKSVFVH